MWDDGFGGGDGPRQTRVQYLRGNGAMIDASVFPPQSSLPTPKKSQNASFEWISRRPPSAGLMDSANCP